MRAQDPASTGSDRGAYEAALGLAWMSDSGCSALLRLLAREGPEAIWRASSRRLSEWGLTPRAGARYQEKRRCFVFDEALRAMAATGIGFLAFGSQLYPPELAHLVYPPAGLFFCGERDALERLPSCPRVTIVGTRRATAYGLRAADAFSSAFADRGIAVVSGMALGIDTQAHKAALGSEGLTVAVLGCGADIVYPRRHRAVYERIARGGLVISELPPGTEPARWTFPHRNRLLAALGDATLVVEASHTSGALQTADQALELGRPVFSIPGSIYADGHQGCNALLYQGAFPALDPFVTVEDFLLLTRIERGGCRAAPTLRPKGERSSSGSSRPGQVQDHRFAGILESLASAPCSVETLMAERHLTVREVTAALGELESSGLVMRGGPGLYIRAP
ncbi:MAG: DNA-processing protein DprA [Thermoleophilia bacterium]|nr:DNA-processing protein DprA [Thermoleophilia bacterium]